jgi:hypothetical protein
MQNSPRSDEHEGIALEIFESFECHPPLYEDVVSEVRKFDALGLTEQQIKKAVLAMFTQRLDDVEKGIVPNIHPEELQAISIPREYQELDR